MKTKLYFIVLVLALVFTSARAQTELIGSFVGYDAGVSSIDFCYADTDGDGIDDYLITIGFTNIEGDGAIKYTNLSTGVTTHESDFPNMGGSNASILLSIISTETGIFVSGIVGSGMGSSYNSLRYYPFFSNNFVSSMEKTLFGSSIYNLTYIDGTIYAYFSTLRTYYDPLSSGYNLPINPNGGSIQAFLVSIDPSTADMNWAWNSIGSIAWLNDGESIQRAPNGNIAVQEANSEGSLFVEIDASNGAYVDTIMTGLDDRYDRYVFDGDYLLKYCETNNKSYKYDSNTLTLLHETTWPQYSHWSRGVDKMRLDPDGNFVFASSSNIGILTENLIHKFVDVRDASYGVAQIIYINPDGSVMYVTQDGNTTNLLKVTLNEDTSLIPMINEDYSANILSIHYGKRIDKDGNFVDGSNSEVVLGYANGTLPNAGDPAPTDLMLDPLGAAHMLITFPFEEVDGTVRIRGSARVDTNQLHDINLLAYCVLQSSLGTNENVIEENTLKVYPSPVEDVLNIDFGREVNLIEIYSLLGKKVAEQTYHNHFGSVYNVDTSLLSSGVYIIKMYGEFGFRTNKIIKR